MKLVEVIYFGFELNLLEAHLDAHRGLADRTIVVECAMTTTGVPKPLLFEQNKARFAKYDVEHVILPASTYPIQTKDFQEFKHQDPNGKYLMHDYVMDADWVFHNDTDEILDSQYFSEIRQRLAEFPEDVRCVHHHLDQRSPFVNTLYGTFHVHRIYRAGGNLPAPKSVKRAPLVSKSDGICGWHFTSCFSTAEELYWKIKTRNWLVPEKSVEFCQKVMDKGLLSITMTREFDDLVQFVPTGSLTGVSVETLPKFMRDNLKMFQVV